MTTKQKFIICKGSSGLGNRILATCTAILYSQISGRELIIDWRDGSYSEQGINAFPLFFKTPQTLSPNSIQNLTSVYPPLWAGQLDRSFSSIKEESGLSEDEISCDVSKIDYSEDIVVFCAYTNKIHRMRNLFKGDFAFLRSLEMPEILRSIIAERIKIDDELTAQIATFKDNNFKDNIIGVHVRQTDMTIPLDALLEMTEKLAKKRKTNRIFLATDSKKTIDIFKEKFEVITYQKWFPPDGQRMHQNWEACPDRVQNGKEALTDLYLLAECDDLVFSPQSSFGYVASLLSQKGKEHLHDVTKPSFLKRVLAKVKK